MNWPRYRVDLSANGQGPEELRKKKHQSYAFRRYLTHSYSGEADTDDDHFGHNDKGVWMKAKPAACKQTKPQAMKRTTEIGHKLIMTLSSTPV